LKVAAWSAKTSLRCSAVEFSVRNGLAGIDTSCWPTPYSTASPKIAGDESNSNRPSSASATAPTPSSIVRRRPRRLARMLAGTAATASVRPVIAATRPIAAGLKPRAARYRLKLTKNSPKAALVRKALAMKTRALRVKPR
jgi:hypothetical protein